MSEKRSSWALLADWVDRPGPALANVTAYPGRRWVLPTVLALAALVTSAFLTAPLMATRVHQMMSGQLAQLPADQLARLQGQLAFFESPLFVGAMAAVGGIVGLLVGWLLQGVIFYLGALIAGSDIELRGIATAVPWLSLPLVLEILLQAVYQVSRGQLIVNQGLSYLVSSGRALEDARNLAYVALSQVSLFRLWHFLLAYKLLRAGARLDSGSALAVTIAYAALSVGAQLALALLAGQPRIGF